MIHKIRRFLAAAAAMFMVIPSFSQVDPFINLGAGYDYNLNKYQTIENYTLKNHVADFNAGGDFGLQTGKNARFHAVFNYVQFAYGRLSTNTYYSESMMRISSLSLTPALDVRLWSTEKLDLYVSAGYLMEWVVDKEETNFIEAGGTDNKNYMEQDFRSFVDGPSGAILLKYKIDKNWAITFKPGYTYFLKKFYADKDELGNLQRLSFNIGVEYLFQLKHKPKTEGFEE